MSARTARRQTRFEILFRAHYQSIVRFCRRRLPVDVADDTVAEVFATAWLRLDDLDQEPGSELPWLYAIARNKVAHQHRSFSRRRSLEDRAQREPSRRHGPDPATHVVAVDEISQAAAQLPAIDQELLQLISWEGLSLTELSVVLGCSVNAATIRVHRMRDRLKGHLTAMKEDVDIGNTPDHKVRTSSRTEEL